MYTNVRIIDSRVKAAYFAGPSVYEIRVRAEAGAFRVIYVAKFEEAVYVLHAFQRKTRETAKADIDLAARRYKLTGGES